MKVGILTAAVGVFMGAVLFDVAPDSAKAIGLLATILLLAVGAVTWAGLGVASQRLAKHSYASITSLAIWLHSFFEGALTALSFKLDFRIGVIVSIGIVLHLLPEFFAVVVLLKHHGYSTKQAVWVDASTVGILAASFTLFAFVFPTASTGRLEILATVVGGAFLYLSSSAAYRLVRSKQTVYGLASGLTLTFAWAVVMGRLFHL